MYVNHKQKVIEREFQKLAEINGITDNLFIEKYKLKLEVQNTAADILLVLNSTQPNTVKISVLEVMGYSHEQALLLCPLDTPTPKEPIKIKP